MSRLLQMSRTGMTGEGEFVMSRIYYAIGDVHGRDDLLEVLHERITAFHHARFANQPATIVHIGDYIDRGANSIGVIDRLMAGVPGFETICLRGNHEDLMLACLDTEERRVWDTWLWNGADKTLNSFGVSFHADEYDPARLALALGEQRISWLRSLPLYHRSPPYLFVHAGIAPGKPVEEQQEKDLLWIRGRFLDHEGDHGCRIVHGHTPANQPVVRPNRICIDTGVISTGILTAAVLDAEAEPLFLNAAGEPGTGTFRR